MKKIIAIMLTLILAAGTFTACRLEEKLNNDIQTSVVSKAADVSISETTFEVSTINQAETTTTVETETTEKATVSKETEPAQKDTKPKEKSDSGQNPAVVSATEATEAVQSSKTENKSVSNGTLNQTEKTTQKSTQPATQKPTEKPKPKPAPKPTQPPTEKKNVDVSSAVSACISYGKQLGMDYDSSLNIGNASWFSPTNASYYDNISELTFDLKSDVEYVAYYYQSSGIALSDLSFNVIAENNKIYVVYC